MHPLYLQGNVFNLSAWFNIVGAIGCIFWILAYVAVIRQSFKDRAYGLPLVAICCNVTWEFLASWVASNPVPLWQNFDRIWFFLDLIIVYQLLRYGPDLQSNAELRKHFTPFVAFTLALALIGQYTFFIDFQDNLGILSAFMINLIMSILFVTNYVTRTDRRGTSVAAAWFKMLGSVGTSIECHYVVRAVDTHLKGLGFLTFLCVSVFVFDCFYIYLVMQKEPKSPLEDPVESQRELQYAA